MCPELKCPDTALKKEWKRRKTFLHGCSGSKSGEGDMSRSLDWVNPSCGSHLHYYAFFGGKGGSVLKATTAVQNKVN